MSRSSDVLSQRADSTARALLFLLEESELAGRMLSSWQNGLEAARLAAPEADRAASLLAGVELETLALCCVLIMTQEAPQAFLRHPCGAEPLDPSHVREFNGEFVRGLHARSAKSRSREFAKQFAARLKSYGSCHSVAEAADLFPQLIGQALSREIGYVVAKTIAGRYIEPLIDLSATAVKRGFAE